MYLPNREELSLRIVFALPNASRIGFDCKSRSRTFAALPVLTELAARKYRIFFEASVFPAPDGDLIGVVLNCSVKHT